MPTRHPVPPDAACRSVLASARRIARRQLGYGYYRSVHAMSTPYVYCPHRHKVEASVPAAATASQVCAALQTKLIEHLIDADEAPVQRRSAPPAPVISRAHGQE
jgi:hypothetical protein